MEDERIKQLLVGTLLEHADTQTSEQVLNRIKIQQKKAAWEFENVTHILLALLLLATGLVLLHELEMSNPILLFFAAVATLAAGMWVLLYVQQQETSS